MKYLQGRFIRAVLVLVGVSALCFLFSQMAPGSFFDEMRLNPQISPETIASLNSRYGLEQPLLVRYGRWVKAATHGDLGYSIAYNLPVAPLLWSRAKNTLLLTGSAMLVTWLISVPLGLWTGLRAGGPLDRIVALSNSFFLCIPEAVIAVGLLAVVVRWRVLPLGGVASGNFEGPLWDHVRDVGSRMLLPMLILVLLESAIIVRHIRAGVIDVLGSPFVEAARSFGIGDGRLLFRHVLPVAANPAISLFGFSLAGLLSGSLLVEVICGWPGLGPLLLEAILSRDFYLVIGGLMFSALFMLGGTMVADVMRHIGCSARSYASVVTVGWLCGALRSGGAKSRAALCASYTAALQGCCGMASPPIRISSDHRAGWVHRRHQPGFSNKAVRQGLPLSLGWRFHDRLASVRSG
ncbi:MAG: ABC transporter substrate-binding protein [Acidobacteria bacterium]|nr:MAG: ABC transporter substrate-binding protein [Acidobacteriota bacterium]